jgi:hypothetical protein
MAAMSFQKKLITLTAVIGALVAAYVLGLVFSPASIRKRELETPLVERLETDAVATIQVSTADGRSGRFPSTGRNTLRRGPG